MDSKNSHISLEQLRYARFLQWGSRCGLLVLVLSFLGYVSGVIPPHVPLDELQTIWGLPLSEYLARTHTPTGWNWLQLATRGDMANLVGIAILCASSLVCLLVVIPVYARRGDRIFVVLCILAILVQVLAASGILNVGH